MSATNEEFNLFEVVFEFGKGFSVKEFGTCYKDQREGYMRVKGSRLRIEPRGFFQVAPLDDEDFLRWPRIGFSCFAKGEADIPRAKQEIHERLCARMRGCKEELDHATKEFRVIQAVVSEAAKDPDLYVKVKE